MNDTNNIQNISLLILFNLRISIFIWKRGYQQYSHQFGGIYTATHLIFPEEPTNLNTEM